MLGLCKQQQSRFEALDQSNGAKGHSTWGQAAAAAAAIYIELQLILGSSVVLPSPPEAFLPGATPHRHNQSTRSTCAVPPRLSLLLLLLLTLSLFPAHLSRCHYHWVCFVLSPHNKCKIKVLEPSVEWRRHKTKAKFTLSEKPSTLLFSVFSWFFLHFYFIYILIFMRRPKRVQAAATT